MIDSTTPASAWHPPTAGRLRRRPSVPAAPDRHPRRGPVALPLCPLHVRRPASTVRRPPPAGRLRRRPAVPATPAVESSIYRQTAYTVPVACCSVGGAKLTI